MKTPSKRYSLENSYYLVGNVARLKRCVRPTTRLIWSTVASSLAYIAKYEAATPNLNRFCREAAWLSWSLRCVAKATDGLGAFKTMNAITGALIQLINDDDKEVQSERVVGLSGKPAISENAASNCRLLEVVMLTISRLVDELGQAATLDGVVDDDNNGDYIHLVSLLTCTLSVCKVLRSWFTMGPQVVYRFHNSVFGAAEWPVV